MSEKDRMAATLSRNEAISRGVLTGTSMADIAMTVTVNSRKLYGFTRKILPTNLPDEPKIYLYSVSEYGGIVDIGPGFRRFIMYECPEGEQHGEPCIINPIYFYEEAKVDVTEHTFHSGQQIADAILKIGPGMSSGWDRRKLGWFQSPYNPPRPEEIQRAQSLYTAECKRLLIEGNGFQARNQMLEINEQHRRAASYLKQKVSWDTPQHKMVDCAGCGEPIREGAIKHAVGYCGAIQPGKWAEAIAHGMARMEDCPQEILDQINEETDARHKAANAAKKASKAKATDDDEDTK